MDLLLETSTFLSSLLCSFPVRFFGDLSSKILLKDPGLLNHITALLKLVLIRSDETVLNNDEGKHTKAGLTFQASSQTITNLQFIYQQFPTESIKKTLFTLLTLLENSVPSIAGTTESRVTLDNAVCTWLEISQIKIR
jgi:hypothetical protein